MIPTPRPREYSKCIILWMLLTLLSSSAANSQIQLTVCMPSAEYHTCVLKDGQIGCWGSGKQGQLGLGNDDNYFSPEYWVTLPTGFDPIGVTAGEYHSCSLSDDGSVACWGYNANGQLGIGSTSRMGEDTNEMVDYLQITDLGTGFVAVQLVAGSRHNCAMSGDQDIKCWGRNQYGQLGYGDTWNRGDDSNEMGDYLPTIEFPDGFTAIKLVAGWYFNCVLGLDQSMAIVCWGRNGNYQLGDGSKVDRGDEANEMGDNMVPVDLGAAFVPIDIEAGGGHVCTMNEDQEIKCWGDNTYGQLGIGCEWTEQFGDDLPVLEFPSEFLPQQMGMGSHHSCFLDFDFVEESDDINGTVGILCFGRNDYGQLGYEDTTNRGDCDGTYENISALSIIDLGSDFEIAQIQIMGHHNCILSTNDALKCFGYNVVGQLGYGDTVNRGDGTNEMGDNLESVDLDFTDNPNIESVESVESTESDDELDGTTATLITILPIA